MAVEITDGNFETVVKNSDKVVLVDFWDSVTNRFWDSYRKPETRKDWTTMPLSRNYKFKIQTQYITYRECD